MNSKFTLVLLLVFSILLALGTWNPFLPLSENSESDGGFSLSQICCVLFIAYLFIVKSLVSAKLIYYSWKRYLILFYMALLFSTFLWGINDVTLSTYLFFVKFFLSISLCFLLPEIFVRNNKYMYYSMLAFSLSCVVISLCFMLGLLENYVIVSKGRVSIFGENPNSTSSRIVVAFILLFFFIIRDPLKWGWKRLLLAISFVPMLVLIIASGSRGSFIILCLCVIFILCFYQNKHFFRKLTLLIFSLSLLIVGIVKIVSNHSDYSLFVRLENSLEYGESGGREALNNNAFLIFEDYPLIGKGSIGFANEMFDRYNETRTVHNLYLYILATSGIVGFMFFCAFSFSLLKKAWSIRKTEHLPLVLLIFIYLLAYKTGGVLTYLLMWYLFAIIISIIDLEFYERKSNSIIDRVEFGKINQ